MQILLLFPVIIFHKCIGTELILASKIIFFSKALTKLSCTIYFVGILKLSFWPHFTNPYVLNSTEKESENSELTHLSVSGPFHSHGRLVSSRWHSRNCCMCGGFFFPVSKISLSAVFLVGFFLPRFHHMFEYRGIWDDCLL